jgi:hypothetical protein
MQVQMKICIQSTFRHERGAVELPQEILRRRQCTSAEAASHGRLEVVWNGLSELTRRCGDVIAATSAPRRQLQAPNPSIHMTEGREGVELN